MLPISRWSHGPSTSQVLSSRSMCRGSVVSITGGLGTYSGSYTVTGGSSLSRRAMCCTNSRVP